MGAQRRAGFLAALIARAERRGGWLFVAGLALVTLYQWRLWQRDRALLAHRRAPPPTPPLEEWASLPRVSALVAAWNEAEQIEAHIGSFLALRYPNKQLVLVAGGEDGTFALAQRYAGPQVVVLEQQAGEGKQGALRRGFAQADGEVIYLTDADCRLDDRSFELLLWQLVAGGEQVVTGSSRPFPEQLAQPFVFSQAAAQTYAAMQTSPHAPGILGRHCMARRQLLSTTRALDLPAPAGTDYVLAKALDRHGVRIRQLPESRVASDYPATARAYLRQQRRWLANVWREGLRAGARREAAAALQNVLVGLGMLALPVVSAWLGRGSLALWGLLAWQAWLSQARYGLFAGQLLRRPYRRSDWLRAPLYLTVDFLAWAGALPAFLRGEGRWE
jgi:hypothetical protein